jgi:hypothetical protein
MPWLMPDKNLDSTSRAEVLKEMEVLQSRLDKYDDLIFRNRGWMVTLVIALVGVAIQYKQTQFAYLAAAISGFFYLVETIWRFTYMEKYISRYRFLRDCLRSEKLPACYSSFDLANEYVDTYGLCGKANKLFWTAFHYERLFFYGASVLGALVIERLMDLSTFIPL